MTTAIPENFDSTTHADQVTTIVAAYVQHNRTEPSEIEALIGRVHTALMAIHVPTKEPEPAKAPAVAVNKSIGPDFIICLEDGKKFKSLKRHLSAHYGLSPDQYREKWNLPPTYPMVAPSYSATRSQLAKKSGLGKKTA